MAAIRGTPRDRPCELITVYTLTCLDCWEGQDRNLKSGFMKSVSESDQMHLSRTKAICMNAYIRQSHFIVVPAMPGAHICMHHRGFKAVWECITGNRILPSFLRGAPVAKVHLSDSENKPLVPVEED
jgi:hypothetical protein